MKNTKKQSQGKSLEETSSRKYVIEYFSSKPGKYDVWKVPPEGIQNVWIRKKSSDYTGTRVVLGYTKLVDGVLTSHTKTAGSTIRSVRRIRLNTYME